MKKSNQAELSLDKNDYMGFTDYEIETEYFNIESMEELLAEINRCSIVLEDMKILVKFSRLKQMREKYEE